jgi:hypothetical protein
VPLKTIEASRASRCSWAMSATPQAEMAAPDAKTIRVEDVPPETVAPLKAFAPLRTAPAASHTRPASADASVAVPPE